MATGATLSSIPELTRIPFTGKPCTSDDDHPVALRLFDPTSNDNSTWIPIVQCAAYFPVEYFSVAMTEILLHPERNTSLILRAEILEDVKLPNIPLGGLVELDGHTVQRNLKRRILPRLPKRDPPLDQDCTFYANNNDTEISIVVLKPELDQAGELPWYHPPVSHIAFRYINAPSGAVLRIEIIPLESTGLVGSSSVDKNSRLYRTCLGLLETLYKYGWGFMTGYKKRVVHDTLVPRDEYQDLYLIMRDHFKGMADEWHEATDASKHVFEDISIATFLLLLWKHTYANGEPIELSKDPLRPWLTWPQPPNGFLDLGCGNGLLVHILLECGYPGLGIDVRARKSWPYYPLTTREHLHAHAFDPTLPTAGFLQRSDPVEDPLNLFPQAGGRFIIGNHADEMQPWLPVIAALANTEFVSIPCCAWDFDSRYQMKKRGKSRAKEEGEEGEVISPEEEALETKLTYDEKDAKLSLYASYTLWLASLSRKCGFIVESEALRIPSTRNWAIVGRKRTTEQNDADGRDRVRNRVLNMLEQVRERGNFKTRIPEGKAGEQHGEEPADDGCSPIQISQVKYADHVETVTAARMEPTGLPWVGHQPAKRPPRPKSSLRTSLSSGDV